MEMSCSYYEKTTLWQSSKNKKYIIREEINGSKTRNIQDARGKMVSGVNVLANAVKVTLGPKGRMSS